MSHRPTILLVEDEPLIADVVTWELEEAGFQVLNAATGDDALAISRSQIFDVLFTDIRMPGQTDGWSLAERVREQRPDLPVIYASGYTPQRSREVAGSIFLPKPYRADMVIAALSKLGVEARR